MLAKGPPASRLPRGKKAVGSAFKGLARGHEADGPPGARLAHLALCFFRHAYFGIPFSTPAEIICGGQISILCAREQTEASEAGAADV